MELIESNHVTKNENQASHIMITVEPGTWWRRKDGSETVRLMSDVKIHEGNVHTVILLNPPGKDEYKTEFLFKNFTSFFEQVTEEFALQVRNNEVAQIQKEINEVGSRLGDQAWLERTALERVTKEHERLEYSSEHSTSSENTFPASQANNELSVHNLELQIKASNELGNVVNEQTSIIAVKSNLIATYASERGQLAEAKTKTIQKGVKNIQTKVETLQIYSGKEVAIHHIVDGEYASNEHKVHLMQRKLYMDEESLINCLDGGADFSSVGVFIESLKEQSELVERILPHPKCVIAMQYRRDEKDYGKASAIESAENNLRNKSAFLIVRNGENLFLIFSEVQSYENLFVSSDEMNRCFTQWGEKVELDSVNFVDSMNRLEGKYETYKRLHLLLVGCYERQPEIFSPLPTENGSILNLLSYQDMKDSFEFVYDVQNAITDSKYPPVTDWFKNKYDIKPGSRILFRPGKYISSYGDRWDMSNYAKRAPSMYSYSNAFGYSLKADISQEVYEQSFIVQEYEGKMFIRVPATRQNKDYDEVEFMMKVYIDEHALDGEFTNEFFCLDTVLPEEIEYYANARESRKYYVKYASMILRAYESVKEDKLYLEPILQDIESSLQLTDLNLEYNALWLAIAKWRTQNKGIMPHKVNKPGYIEFMKWISEFLFNKKEDKTQDILNHCKELGYTPVLIKHGKSWDLYREMTKEDTQETFPFYGRTLVKHKVSFNKKGIKLSSSTFVSVNKLSAKDERTWEDKELLMFWKKSSAGLYLIKHPIHDLELKKLFSPGLFMHELSALQVKRASESIQAGQKMMFDNQDVFKDFSDSELHKAYSAWHERWRYTEKGYLTSHEVFIPVGCNEDRVLGLNIPEELFLFWKMPKKYADKILNTVSEFSNDNYAIKQMLIKANANNINGVSTKELLSFIDTEKKYCSVEGLIGVSSHNFEESCYLKGKSFIKGVFVNRSLYGEVSLSECDQAVLSTVLGVKLNG